VRVRHVAYPKIPAVSAGAAAGGPWTATEKIHGAQLVIGYEGEALHVGKRRAWLADGEAFFGWQLLRPRFALLAEAALARGGTSVRVYGELFGGHYPHPDVPPAAGASPVQTGVWYSPDIRFAVFDVLRDDTVYLPYADLRAIAGESGVDVVPLLGRGPRPALDALPVRFPTRLPAALGLPDLPDNIAEGLVLRPDPPAGTMDRPIVKRKIEEFDEKRFNDSRPCDPWQHIPIADLRELAHGLVNPPRLASARAKVGPTDLLDEIVLDVMVDLSEAFPVAIAALTPAEEADLHAYIRALAAAKVKP
jgi:Rnl2 family RNA ligase